MQEHRGAERREEGGNKPNKTITHPADSQHPPGSVIASETRPPQHQVGREGPPCHERREEDQHCPAHVVDRLQEEDLSQDLQRRQLRQGARARWPAAARHSCAVWSVVQGLVSYELPGRPPFR